MIDIAALAAQVRRVNPRWMLRLAGDEIELIGNGTPAAWKDAADCAAWLSKQKRHTANNVEQMEMDL